MVKRSAVSYLNILGLLSIRKGTSLLPLVMVFMRSEKPDLAPISIETTILKRR